MMLIDLLNTDQTDETPLEELASLGIEVPRAAVIVASPELAPILEFDEQLNEDAAETEAAGNTQGHAAMFGRYLGQITARIERAWLRPRTAIQDAARFSCQAKIEQNETGKVLSIELRHCNGNARWQRSLVSAIEHASPLPAPPIPSVFARMLVLNFSSSPWQEGISSAHMYETGTPLASAEPATEDTRLSNAHEAPLDVASHRGHIDLRIEGDALQWTLHDATDEAQQVSAKTQ